MKGPMPHVDSMPPPRSGMYMAISNRTPIARSQGKMWLKCPICAIEFERYACHAKRSNLNTCSVACANKAKEVRVEKGCGVCGKLMLLTPVRASRTSACSPACSSERKRGGKNTGRKASTAAYKAAAEEVKSRGVCSQCGVAHGPWVARGISVEIVDRMPVASAAAAELWCAACHIAAVWPVGLAAQGKWPSQLLIA